MLGGLHSFSSIVMFQGLHEFSSIERRGILLL
jgi:hypothetical protein